MRQRSRVLIVLLATISAAAMGPRAVEAGAIPGEHDLIVPPRPALTAGPRGEGLSSRTADWVVRTIYFEPTDRAPWPRLAEELDRMVQMFQSWFSREMERHGFPGRRLRMERHAD